MINRKCLALLPLLLIVLGCSSMGAGGGPSAIGEVLSIVTLPVRIVAAAVGAAIGVAVGMG